MRLRFAAIQNELMYCFYFFYIFRKYLKRLRANYNAIDNKITNNASSYET